MQNRILGGDLLAARGCKERETQDCEGSDTSTVRSRGHLLGQKKHAQLLNTIDLFPNQGSLAEA